MKQYKVKVTIQASKHILEYAKYIRNELLNQQAARNFVDRIGVAIKSLCDMPYRNPLVDEEPWRSKGIHKMIVRGYIIYYWVEEESEVVHVTGVIYEKMNQIDQLMDIDFEQ